MAYSERSNIVLIGMPGVGKSTVGRRLARRLGWPFVDTDAVIEHAYGSKLSELIATRGLEAFRQLEESTVAALAAERSVIATGGSVVYGDRAMQSLRRSGRIVFLHAELSALAARVGDPGARGMVIAPGQSLASLYAERLPLYRRYADLTVATGRRGPEAVAKSVVAQLQEN